MPKGAVLPVPLICTVRFGAAMRLEPDENKEAFLQRARERWWHWHETNFSSEACRWTTSCIPPSPALRRSSGG